MFWRLENLRRQHHKKNASQPIWSGWRKLQGMRIVAHPYGITAGVCYGERKSVEPMAARLAPDRVQRMHESLHHCIAQSPWKDADMLRQVRAYVLPAMQKNGPVTAWVVDETSLVKKGTHSVGVARQYSGRLGRRRTARLR